MPVYWLRSITEMQHYLVSHLNIQYWGETEDCATYSKGNQMRSEDSWEKVRLRAGTEKTERNKRMVMNIKPDLLGNQRNIHLIKKAGFQLASVIQVSPFE